ncbi:MAG: phage terminase large subunit [bacterium]
MGAHEARPDQGMALGDGSHQGGWMSAPDGRLDPLKADFRNFLYAIWQFLGLPVPTDLQYDIASFLQHGPRRFIIEAFRGVGKSWITAAFVIWLLYCDPNKRIFVLSANADRASAFTTFVLRLINEIPWLSHLRPRHDQRQSTLAFDVGPSAPDQAPSVRSLGITGQMTGGRADYIVADDIEIPHNSDTPPKRERLLELVKELDAVLKPGGRVCYLGTPQTEQTIYQVLTERGYVMRVWPAKYPAAIDKYAGNLAPIITKRIEENPLLVGKPTDPARFDEVDLEERALSYGRSGFALQFMLDTQLSDAEKHPLKLSDLIIHPLDPYQASTNFVWAADPRHVLTELPMVGLHGDRYYHAAWCSEDFAEYEGTVMFIDPSGRGSDETSYAVVSLLYGRLFLRAAGGYLGGGGYDEETLGKLLAVAKKHGVQYIRVEPNFGGGMFTQLLISKATEVYPCDIEDAKWATMQKEMRIIDTLEPVMNQHKLIVCPSVIESDFRSTQAPEYGDKSQLYRLAYQMTRITRDKGALAKDDRIDALAGAVAHWMEELARDTHQAALEHKDKALDKELQKFLQHALGRDYKDPSIEAAYRLRSSAGRRSQQR